MDSVRSLGNFLNVRPFAAGTEPLAATIKADREAKIEMHRLDAERQAALREALDRKERADPGPAAFVDVLA